MKKVLLTGFVVVTFVIYSIQQRRETPKLVISSPVSIIPGSQTTQNPASTSPDVSQTAPRTTTQQTAAYKDGSYIGDVTDAFYGNIQVRVTVQAHQITDVVFLQYPNDRRNSIEINQYAMPYLKQEAIKAQNSQVDIVSGATDTSNAFVQSLASALTKAS